MNDDLSFLFEENLNEKIFFEMANFHKEESGLSHNIWLDELGKDRNSTHNLMRIKVEDPNNKKNLIPVEISENPRILAGHFENANENINDIYKFIILAYSDLVKHWNGKMTSLEFMNKYKK